MADIIGLLGLQGSGKGTVGDILVQEGYVKFAFADTVKDAVAVIFGLDRSLLEGDTIESREFREQVDTFWSEKFGYKITPRILLQKFGTDWTRKIFLDSIWISSLEKKILLHEKVVVCDVRFDNEIKFLHGLGAKLYEVQRPENFPEWYKELKYFNTDFNKESWMMQWNPDIHVSEWGWINHSYIDDVILNEGTIEDLLIKVKDKIL